MTGNRAYSGTAEELQFGKHMLSEATGKPIEGLGQAVFMDQACKGGSPPRVQAVGSLA